MEKLLSIIGRRSSLLIWVGLFSTLAFGQADTLNQTDDNGLKQGYWIIWGKYKPEKGYPADGIIEEGTYKDDRKNGVWTKYHKDGNTRRLKGTYVNNRPNGEYWKYYLNGTVMEHGFFYGGKTKQVFERYYESGCMSQKRTDSLTINYYDDCKLDSAAAGTIEAEYGRYQPGKIEQERSEVKWGKSEIKQLITYDSLGRVTEKSGPMTGPIQEAVDFSVGKRKDNKPIDPNGYNKIFNKDDEVWYDGELKAGKMWNGKLYKYDSDGILLKIEIYKNGKYHSDGQL